MTAERDSGRLVRAVGNGPWETKFAVPRAVHVVDRPRLFDRLDAESASPVTLLSAPAGWGKTLLVSTWLRARSTGPVAWLTLGPAENDRRSFWRAVAAARATAGVTPAVLVLDDLHAIHAPEVHESLVELVIAGDPETRLVVLTRNDPPWPVHRLRLAGLLAEVGAGELAFSAGEARELCTCLGVALADDQLDVLLERTDGWAAALRLAVLPLRAADVDVPAFVASFSGDERAVTSYVEREILAPLAPAVRTFLEEICLLDLVCAELADAVTGGDDGAAMLAELAAAHLFVAPAGASGHWFRLPRVLTDVLRARTTEPRDRRDRHRRAAEWYRRRSLPAPAIGLALRGGLMPLAAELVGRHVVGLVLRGRARELEAMLAPVSRDALLAHPELAAGLAGARMVYGHSEEVAELVTAATARVEGLTASRARRVRLVLDLIRIADARRRGDLDGLAAACGRIPLDPAELAELGLSDWDLIRMLTLSNRGTAALWLGDLDAAEGHLRAATEIESASVVIMPRLNAQAHLALLACERGDLDAAERDARAVAAQAAAVGTGATVQAVAAYLALARVHLDRDELGEVEPWLARVAEVEAGAPEPHVQLAAAVLRARSRADADPEAALLDLQGVVRGVAAAILPERIRDRGLLAQVELAERLGDPGLARIALAALHAPSAPDALLAAAGVDLLERDPDAAARRLGALGGTPTTPAGRVTADVVRALVARARGDEPSALRALDDALRRAAPQHLRRPFTSRAYALRALVARRIEHGTEAAGFAVELLSRMNGADSAATDSPRPAPIPLTPRETVILRYLASTLTNSEMASELSVSVNTVKTHQQTVYRKLAVAGRREAVRRARVLRLI